MHNMAKRAKKEDDSGEGTLLSLHMIQNFHYLPSGERLTNKVKKRLLQKLQETYVTSYHHYFSHHPAITIDANQDKNDVFKQITSALSPVTSSNFTRGSFRRIPAKKREKVSA